MQKTSQLLNCERVNVRASFTEVFLLSLGYNDPYCQTMFKMNGPSR